MTCEASNSTSETKAMKNVPSVRRLQETRYPSQKQTEKHVNFKIGA